MAFPQTGSLKKMADQVYMVYYQLMQESVNFTIETDSD